LKNISGSPTTYVYDVANQLVYGQDSTGRTSYIFDAAGNQQLTLDPVGNLTTVTWNFENQPVLYQFPIGTRATYMYNADNRRVQEET
jgi:uncharacterized protein RhaS with RHS repeats